MDFMPRLERDLGSYVPEGCAKFSAFAQIPVKGRQKTTATTAPAAITVAAMMAN
jgi:hypothetical protein